MAWIGAALDRGCRGARGPAVRLLVTGAAATLGTAVLAAAAAWAVLELARPLGGAALLVEALLLKSTLSVRGLAAAALGVASALERGRLDEARTAAGRHLVSRPTAALDRGRVASAAVESVAENLTDSIVAPVLFHAVLGVPGAVFYRAVNTADAMIGYRGGVLEHLGKVAARLDDGLNWLPARVAALALVVAAPLAGGRGGPALAILRRDGRRTASPNAGLTMSAMAGALGVRLEKPGHYALGDGRLPGAAEIRRGVRTMGVAAAVVIAAAALVGLS